MSNKHTEKVVIEIGVSEITKRVISEMQDQNEITKTAEGSLVKAKQTEKILTVTDNTLWRWEKSGYLIPVRIGSKRMYRVSDLEAILKGEKIKPKKPQK